MRAATTWPTGSAPHEAVGPGAHAFDGATRRWNAARLDRYLAALLRRRTARRRPCRRVAVETLDRATARSEALVLGLRTDRGLPRWAANEPPLADSFGWALAAELLHHRRGGSDRADDPRQAALERAALAPGVTPAALRHRLGASTA